MPVPIEPRPPKLWITRGREPSVTLPDEHGRVEIRAPEPAYIHVVRIADKETILKVSVPRIDQVSANPINLPPENGLSGSEKPRSKCTVTEDQITRAVMAGLETMKPGVVNVHVPETPLAALAEILTEKIAGLLRRIPAPQVNVTMPDQPPPVVNIENSIETPSVTVNAPRLRHRRETQTVIRGHRGEMLGTDGYQTYEYDDE